MVCLYLRPEYSTTGRECQFALVLYNATTMTSDPPTTDETHTDGAPPRRVAIFIDGSNLYHSLEENCGRYDLNFHAFAQKLARGRTMFRTYYYNVLQDPERSPQGYQDQQKFLTALYNTPYLEVRLGGAKTRGATTIQKGVDIMIAIDLLRFAWEDRYDVAVLVSGDGDFAYAVQTVKDMGKHVEVAAFPANLSWELVNVSDDREFFTPDYFEDLWSRRRFHPNERGAPPGRDAYRSAFGGPRSGGHREYVPPAPSPTPYEQP